MNQKQWIALTIDVMLRTDSPLSGDEIAELEDTFTRDAPPNRLNERIQVPLVSEIFSRGAAQQSFGDPNRLKEKILHDSVEVAFPGATTVFWGLTRSFLTFRIEALDCLFEPPKTNIKVILGKIIEIYSDAFFPSPQVRKPIPPNFARAQRELISAFGPDINSDEFFRKNPLFTGTERQVQNGSGCLILVLALTSGTTVSAACLIRNLFV